MGNIVKSGLRNSFLFCTASVIAITVAGLGAARAQDNSDAETVVVTGSRVSTPGFQSPTPVTAIDAKSLALKSDTALHDLEYDIPQLAPNQAVVSQSGNPGLSTFNLRNLGPTRTLVLMNGMRVMPSEPTNNTIDTNQFPAILINNVNVVTGGASAAYGSDAVAGVVNFTIDNAFDGFKSSLQAGMTEYSDYKNVDLAFAYGTGFGPGDKGHVVVSGDWYVNSGVNSQTTRPWDYDEWGLVSQPNSTILPHNFVSGNTKLATENPGGIITSPGVLKGITFAPDGTPSQFCLWLVGRIDLHDRRRQPRRRLRPVRQHLPRAVAHQRILRGQLRYRRSLPFDGGSDGGPLQLLLWRHPEYRSGRYQHQGR